MAYLRQIHLCMQPHAMQSNIDCMPAKYTDTGHIINCSCKLKLTMQSCACAVFEEGLCHSLLLLHSPSCAYHHCQLPPALVIHHIEQHMHHIGVHPFQIVLLVRALGASTWTEALIRRTRTRRLALEATSGLLLILLLLTSRGLEFPACLRCPLLRRLGRCPLAPAGVARRRSRRCRERGPCCWCRRARRSIYIRGLTRGSCCYRSSRRSWGWRVGRLGIAGGGRVALCSITRGISATTAVARTISSCAGRSPTAAPRHAETRRRISAIPLRLCGRRRAVASRRSRGHTLLEGPGLLLLRPCRAAI